MAETVDELLVKLGLETDAKSFKEADSQFSGLKARALQVGAAIGVAFAGAGAGLVKMSADTANARDSLGKWADAANVSIQYADRFRHAMERAGGTEQDAQGLLDTVNKLRDAAMKGEMPEWAFEVAGFNPSDIQGMGVEQATNYLMQGISGIQDEDQQRRVAGELGFSSPQALGVMTNYGRTQEDMKRAEDLGEVTQDLIDKSADYTAAIVDAERVMRSLKDMIAGDLLPSMTQWAEALAEWTTANRSQIEKAWEFANEFDKDAVIDGVISGLTDGDADLLGTGGSLLKWLGENSGISAEEGGAADQMIQKVFPDPYTEIDGIQVPSHMLKREPDASGRIQRDDQSSNLPQYLQRGTPEFASMQPQQAKAGATNYYSIDARGATDPAATEAHIRRVFDERLGNAVQMGKDEFPNNVS